MSPNYLRFLVGRERSQRANRQLALVLAFIAGATNAGGFLAVHQYTSHMSGVTSSIADNLALGELGMMFAGVGAVIAFASGAACTAILVNWGRRRRLHAQYAAPLMLESVLLVCFGMAGAHLNRAHVAYASLTVLLLCFTMGLQNAIITKISKAEIRTTHMTGIVTDIGIELGKAFYVNRKKHTEPVRAELGKLGLLCGLIGLFFLGGTLGALGFKHVGFVVTLPLAGVLLALGIVPIFDDIRLANRRIAVSRSRNASRERRGSRSAADSGLEMMSQNSTADLG